PMEVRVLARDGGALMLVSNTGGLAEQVTDGVDGFVARQDDVEDTARKLEQILALSDDQRAQVRRNGLETVLRQYTWASQILRTLASMVPEVAKVEDGVRDRLVRDALSQLKAA
ncbi:MAG: glycosyltransferase, partial [Chloroflexota bacterium]